MHVVRDRRSIKTINSVIKKVFRLFKHRILTPRSMDLSTEFSFGLISFRTFVCTDVRKFHYVFDDVIKRAAVARTSTREVIHVEIRSARASRKVYKRLLNSTTEKRLPRRAKLKNNSFFVQSVSRENFHEDTPARFRNALMTGKRFQNDVFNYFSTVQYEVVYW